VNAPLMRMLCDYAHERWAAGRTVSPELWRCVGPVADDAAVEDLAKVLREGNEAERQGAALALSSAAHSSASDLLAKHPDLASAISTHRVSWDSLV
jgi:hypothetical protein